MDYGTKNSYALALEIHGTTQRINLKNAFLGFSFALGARLANVFPVRIVTMR
jgi:hypothetical protein